MDENTNVAWNLHVPRMLDLALEKAVRTDSHVSKSELIRDLVRREVEKRGFLETVREEG